MKVLLLGFVPVLLCAQATVSLKQKYYAAETGVLLVARDGGLKRADVVPGFSYIPRNGGSLDEATLMSSDNCSNNHHISEVLAPGADGRYVMRSRPNPAYIAVYRGGTRLTPDVHYKLVYLDPSKLPDRFELLPGAPTTGTVVVDYFRGTDADVPAAPVVAGLLK